MIYLGQACGYTMLSQLILFGKPQLFSLLLEFLLNLKLMVKCPVSNNYLPGGILLNWGGIFCSVLVISVCIIVSIIQIFSFQK